jgi:hypothetical protein
MFRGAANGRAAEPPARTSMAASRVRASVAAGRRLSTMGGLVRRFSIGPKSRLIDPLYGLLEVGLGSTAGARGGAP